jgi:hypothetical protein
MWHNNKTVQYVYVIHVSQAAWAIFAGIPGWKRIKPGAPDGVTNVTALLCAAKANNRNVNVYIVGNEIQRAVML